MSTPQEISNVIKLQIENYKERAKMQETGKVILVGDGIARVYGLENCMANELLEFDDGSFGMAQNLEKETVSVAVLSNKNNIKEGSVVKRTGKVLSVPVGEKFLGRVVLKIVAPALLSQRRLELSKEKAFACLCRLELRQLTV